MNRTVIASRTLRHVSAFDEVVSRYAETITSFTETEALETSHWEMGEDSRLREDIRFRSTPWGRWILSKTLLANDALYLQFVRELSAEVDLTEALDGLASVAQRLCVFCDADDRFVLKNGKLRLSAKELSRRPLLKMT